MVTDSEYRQTIEYLRRRISDLEKRISSLSVETPNDEPKNSTTMSVSRRRDVGQVLTVVAEGRAEFSDPAGDVIGTPPSVDHHIPQYDGTTGKIIEDSGIAAADVSAAISASHARSHVITSTSDHTSTATSGKMLKADANGLPVDASNTDAEVSGAVSASHTQNTDTGTTSNTFTVDSDSTTGKIILDVALGAADKSLTLTNTALTDNRTITFKDADGTVAFTSDITTPDKIEEGNSKVEVIDSGSGYVSIYIDGAECYRLYTSGIYDTSGNEILCFGSVASALNQVVITNAATGNPALIAADGETNAGIRLNSKGTGEVGLHIGGGTSKYVQLENGASAFAIYGLDCVVEATQAFKVGGDAGIDVSEAIVTQVTQDPVTKDITVTTKTLTGKKGIITSIV